MELSSNDTKIRSSNTKSTTNQMANPLEIHEAPKETAPPARLKGYEAFLATEEKWSELYSRLAN
jgi:hypothetical protein